MVEAVIDASAPSLLQQGFQSLGDTIQNVILAALLQALNLSAAAKFLSFSYLSELVGLFSLSHGGVRGERLAGLGRDAGPHLCFFFFLGVLFKERLS